MRLQAKNLPVLRKVFDEGSGAVGHFMIAYDLESHIDEVTNEEIINDITMHMCNTSEN